MAGMESTPPVEIRFLDADDVGAYWQLRLEALEREPDAFSSAAEEHRSLSLEDVRMRLCSDPANNFVVGALVGGRLVGTAGFYREQGLKRHHKGHIWGVYLTAEMRGRRIGRRMLVALLERAAKMEAIEQVVLSVTTTQDSAIALYRSLGFESFGREIKALKIGERYIDEDHMVLHFEPADRT